MSKLILVTGSAGFVGTNLVHRLLKEGHSVIGLDNFATSKPWKSKLFADNKQYEFWEHDICEDLMPVLNDSSLLKQFDKVDEVYNLASMADPKKVVAQPLVTIQTNTVGLINVLEVARNHNATFLEASTSEIYGEPQVHPQSEDYYGNVNTVDPRAGYNESKRLAETICYSYRQLYSVDTKIVRIFNTYGPHMDIDDGRVVGTFILQALAGDDITIFGDGNQTRSFQYIDDLIEGIMKLMASPDDYMGPVNIGNPEEITVLDLAKLILEKIPSSSNLVFKPMGEGDPLRRKPAIDLARKQLQWEPKISTSAGIDKTIAYFKSQLNSSSV